MAILLNSAHVIGKPIGQTRQTENPEDQAEGQGHATLETGGFALQLERDDDGNGDNGEVHGETQPGEKGALVGAVVAGVGGGVFEEEGAEEREGEKDVAFVFEVSRVELSWVSFLHITVV